MARTEWEAKIVEHFITNNSESKMFEALRLIDIDHLEKYYGYLKEGEKLKDDILVELVRSSGSAEQSRPQVMSAAKNLLKKFKYLDDKFVGDLGTYYATKTSYTRSTRPSFNQLVQEFKSRPIETAEVKSTVDDAKQTSSNENNATSEAKTSTTTTTTKGAAKGNKNAGKVQNTKTTSTTTTTTTTKETNNRTKEQSINNKSISDKIEPLASTNREATKPNKQQQQQQSNQANEREKNRNKNVDTTKDKSKEEENRVRIKSGFFPNKEETWEYYGNRNGN